MSAAEDQTETVETRTETEHRWELIDSSYPDGRLVEHYRCSRCGLQARSRTDGQTSLGVPRIVWEVLPDGSPGEWEPDSGFCAGEASGYIHEGSAALPAETVTPYPLQPELIGEPAAVADGPEPEEDEPSTTPAPRPVRRRHRWDLLGGSFTMGDETSTVERLRCRRCGIQARRVPTRTGRGLRLEVLPDCATTWTAEIGECPGADEGRELLPRSAELEQRVEELDREVSGLLREVAIRGELLDRVKVATGETWWHGAVERVEEMAKDLTSPMDGSYRSLVAGWHRKAQECDHWKAKYERQSEHSKRVEGERATLRESHDRLVQQVVELSQQRAGSSRRPLPLERPAVTHKFRIAGQKGYLTVGMYPDTGRPGEVFAVMAKQGSTLAGLLDAWCRACSMALQYGMPVEDLVEKFRHFRFEPAGFTETEGLRHADSIVDYIARWIGLRFCPAPAAEAQHQEGEQP